MRDGIRDNANNGDKQQSPLYLNMTTLGNVTQIGLFLFMSLCPRWPRKVSNDCRCCWHYRVTFANVNDPSDKEIM